MSVPRIFQNYAANELGPAVGELKIVTANRSGTMGTHLTKHGVSRGSIYTSVAEAEDSLTTFRNDTLLITPESHAWRGDSNATATALTWDKSCTHMIGMDPGGKGGYQRARFSHAGYTMANFMTVSGAENTFRHLRWMHGASTGGASDVTCLTVTGDGNSFKDCCFGGPNDSTQAASANYKGVVLNNAEQSYFKDCTFGTHNDIRRTAANAVLSLEGTVGGMNIFEDCIFVSRATAATPYFINDSCSSTGFYGWDAIFLNCQFLNTGTALTLGIEKASKVARKLYFDNRCSFVNVVDVVAADREAEVFWGGAGANPDSAAIADDLRLGIAQTIDHT